MVTGGAVRLGRAIALECARAGASVAFTYNQSAAQAARTLSDLQATGNGEQRFASFQADVSQSADVKALVSAVQNDLGGATMLVNNAAIFRRTPFATMTEADFDDHIAANLKGPYLLCKYFGDVFLAQEHGSILNIADIYALRPLKNYVPYCLSKAGVVMLTQTLALALSPHVRVNAICPGTILTPSEIQDEDDAEAQLLPKIPLGRLGTPQEIAQTAAFLLGGPQFISGAVVPVDGAQRLR
ncbi:MAG: pteridine reductase [Abditibacteriota bacterium]|nr:pteridine reductase [Abditibacteriota bacterium]